ncbi:hypothetical protein F3Y22_tig00116964pilonHSYRG00319 [Hibiscus syriacus]|uniref:GH10 domain-containing protein n=1 Tax=Hibiscus syriacus TaxID=106335 RepID=A0A6A2XLE3_HIBSY|nr:hypothetical protein F3Y22_tig00116964pilonHSYRG00319 [Hibiscus syriacus]
MGIFFFSLLFHVFLLVLHWGFPVESAYLPNLQAFETNPSLHVINQSKRAGHHANGSNNIILNPTFEDGPSNWSGKGCDILLHESMGDGKVLPLYSKFFASATNRTRSWNGIEQEITGRVQPNLAYEVTVVVRIYGGNITNANIQTTLWVQNPDIHEQYIKIAIVQATDKDWVQLQGKFLLNGSPLRVIIFVEGPPLGTDILFNSLVVKHAEKVPHSLRPFMKNEAFGVNIIDNSNLDDGINGWFPLGNFSLSMEFGSPIELPPIARNSLGFQECLSGRVCLGQIGSGSASPQIVNVALSVDGNWVNGGQVEFNDESWHEVGGSFRIDKQPSNVMVYIQGPAAGVDLMVAGLWIFPVDLKARFKLLKKQTDKIRKRDLILKFSSSEAINASGAFVQVKQIQNSFPFGSCITRSSIDNEGLVQFLVKNFIWVVFGNELKWSWTEPQQDNFNYKDADELLEFCKNHSLEIRGHCIFWEVEYAIQPWVQGLNKSGLITAVQNRLTDLLTRYKGNFRHYDVDNEMLHGSFYKDRLGKNIQATMFKISHQLDSSATLFVNDYHIEDGSDVRSSPEEYIRQILDLQHQGAPVGALEFKGTLTIQWGRLADDLEVMLREAFAHPSVEGIMLWGFWELYMSRENAHLVNVEGKINAASKRYLALKEEWLSHARGYIDAQGEFRFRGFYGTHNIEINSPTTKINGTFVVDKGESPLAITIDL